MQTALGGVRSAGGPADPLPPTIPLSWLSSSSTHLSRSYCLHALPLAADLQPHRWRYWLTRTDPGFEEIAARILDLYESPPEGRLLCFDEKTQLQALERKHVGRPLRPGDPERVEFEYKRGGTLNLFCTLDVRTGEVFGQTCARKRAVDVLDFLGALRSRYPGEVLHVILDNLSTHKTTDVLDFVARDQMIHLSTDLELEGRLVHPYPPSRPTPSASATRLM